MNRYFTLCVVIFLTSCHLGKKQYSYIEIVNSPTKGIIEKAQETFFEVNDSLAYDWAMNRFMVSKRTYELMSEKNVQQATPNPISFVLLDKSERRIYRGDNNIAFKTAHFGMNQETVATLNLFNGNHPKLNIGSGEFSVNMEYTENNSLYWVDFLSDEYVWTDFYDKVRPLAEDMYQYLVPEYGCPTFVNEMPSRNKVERAEIIWPIYVWDMPQKYVVVAIDAVLPTFYVTTRIIDKKRWFSLFNNDIPAAKDAYWSKMGPYAASYHHLQIKLKKIDGSW